MTGFEAASRGFICQSARRSNYSATGQLIKTALALTIGGMSGSCVLFLHVCIMYQFTGIIFANSINTYTV